MTGKAVCRMHGARAGAPIGNRNARKHGLYTAGAIDERRLISELIKRSRQTASSDLFGTVT